MRIRFAATKDDFLVVIAAGNDGAGSPDKTVATASFFSFCCRMFVFVCFELFSLMFATAFISILSDWGTGSVQELPVCGSDPAQRGPTHCRLGIIWNFSIRWMLCAEEFQ